MHLCSRLDAGGFDTSPDTSTDFLCLEVVGFAFSYLCSRLDAGGFDTSADFCASRWL